MRTSDEAVLDFINTLEDDKNAGFVMTEAELMQAEKELLDEVKSVEGMN